MEMCLKKKITFDKGPLRRPQYFARGDKQGKQVTNITKAHEQWETTTIIMLKQFCSITALFNI
jgi:hypothetical protein